MHHDSSGIVSCEEFRYLYYSEPSEFFFVKIDMTGKNNRKNSVLTLIIKNMVCDRCIRVVKEEFENIGLDVRSIKLGEVQVAAGPEQFDREKVRKVLDENGFELIDDKNVKIIEQIKTAIIDLIHHSDSAEGYNVNFPQYVSEKVGRDYHYLSHLFSSTENVTIEKYIILQRIEKVKELLVYGELTLSEIAYKMGYSSVQHLSSQFKDVTGFTPSHFKKIRAEKRLPLDKVGEGK